MKQIWLDFTYALKQFSLINLPFYMMATLPQIITELLAKASERPT